MKKIILLLFICFNLYQINGLGNKLNTEEVFLIKASSVFLKNNDSLIKLRFDKIYNLIQEQDYEYGLKNALFLLDDCKKLQNHYWIYKCEFIIADIFKKTNKFDKSLRYSLKALAKVNLTKVENNESRITDLDYARSLLRVATSFHNLYVSIDLDKLKNYSELDGLELIKKKKTYIDSAKIYYKKVEKLTVLNNEIEKLQGIAFTNISSIYEQDSIFSKAEYYVTKAIEIHQKNNDNLKTAKALNNLGNIFLSQEFYQKSKVIYTKALKLIKNDNNSNTIRAKQSLYYNLGWAMRNLEEFEAYDFQEKYYEIEEDRRDKEFKGKIDEINAEFDFDSQKEILLNKEENKRLKSQRIFLVFGIVGLIIIISLIYWLNLYKLKQKNLALELSQSELIQNKNLDKLKSESQTRILNATLDGKEIERKQIAETLHDSVSALLSSANLHLQATRKQFNGNTPIEIDKTQEIILEASHKIRDLSHNLVSSVLLKFGLDFAIKDIAEKYSNSELNIETEINNVGRYHQKFEIKVYNIIQEFVNNILKHSQANDALIELREENNKIYLTISDDGLGFDKTKIAMKDGLGINQIDARIEVMKGRFHIETSLNNGTKVLVQLPILEKEELNHV